MLLSHRLCATVCPEPEQGSRQYEFDRHIFPTLLSLLETRSMVEKVRSRVSSRELESFLLTQGEKALFEKPPFINTGAGLCSRHRPHSLNPPEVTGHNLVVDTYCSVGIVGRSGINASR